MKKVMMTLVILFVSVAGFAQMASAELKETTSSAESVKWRMKTADLGKLQQGKPGTAVYEFTNTGKEVMLITGVQASCGCTSPEYSKDPILPGKTGFVKATYNAANVGTFAKTVTVTTSLSDQPMVLSLKGEVVAP